MELIEKESDIQNVVCEYLALKKHFFWRQNTTGTFDAKGNFFRKRSKYMLDGVPDIIVIWNGDFIGLEIKRKGNKQSLAQKEFEKGVKEAGGEYYVIRNIDELKEIGL